jgi:hypothetical protein
MVCRVLLWGGIVAVGGWVDCESVGWLVGCELVGWWVRVRKLACRVFLFALCRLRCRLRSSFVHVCGTGVGFREVTAGVVSSFSQLLCE